MKIKKNIDELRLESERLLFLKTLARSNKSVQQVIEEAYDYADEHITKEMVQEKVDKLSRGKRPNTVIADYCLDFLAGRIKEKNEKKKC